MVIPRKQLISKIKEGSAAHVQELYRSFKDEDLSLELLKVTLNHLRPELVPEIEATTLSEAHAHPGATLGVASLALLTKLAEALRFLPEMKEVAIPLLTSSMDAMLKWINFALDFALPRGEEAEENVAYTFQPDVLFKVGSLDVRMGRAALHSKAFLHTFFRVWTARNPSGGRHEVFWDFRPWNLVLDPILTTAMTLLAADRKQSTLILGEELFAQDLGHAFVFATMQRVRQACKALGQPQYTSIEGLVRYGITLVQLVADFTRQRGDRKLETLRRYFEEYHYVPRLTTMLDKLTAALVAQKQPGDNSEKLFVKVAQATLMFLDMLFIDGPHTPRRVGAFLWAGGMPLLARLVMEVNDEDNPKAVRLATALNSMIPFLMWNCALRRCVELDRRPIDPAMARIARHPQHKRLWEEFWSVARQRAFAYHTFCDARGSVVCDNPLCPRDNRALKRSAKQCSRCFSVLYCSVECQRRDWSQRHRDECPSARKMYFTRREAGEVYGHRARAFHVRMVAVLCEERFMSIYQRKVGRWGLAIHDFYPIFECQKDINEEFVYFRTHPTPDLWMHKPDAPLVEKYLWPRMKALGEDFTERMKGSDMRLAEAVFALGPRTDVYVYVLLKQTGNEFKAVYSIPRIAHNEKRYPTGS